MAISVTCDACDREYRVKDELAGKRIKCKECGGLLVVPSPDADESEELAEEVVEAPLRRRAKSSKRTSQSAHGGRSSTSGTLEAIFVSDRTVWMKMLGGAVAAPIVVMSAWGKQRRRGGAATDFSDPTTILILLSSVVLGAIAGALLTAKDVVQTRLQNGDAVAFPWVLMFGKGMISLLCVWFPLVILVTFVVTMLTLGI